MFLLKKISDAVEDKIMKQIKKVWKKFEKSVLYRDKPVQYARKIGVAVGDDCKFMGFLSLVQNRI